jgi:DNA-binding NtrC family response regulator
MEDVPMLAEHFLQIYAEKYKRQDLEFSQFAYDQMLNYSWRGNVRELQHVIERAVLLSKGGRINNLDVPKNMDSSISFADIKRESSGGEKTFNSEPVSANGVSNGNGNFLKSNLSGEELFEEVGKFIVEKLPEPIDGAEQKDVFNELENVVVMAALKRTKGNKQAAANLLGLYRPRLYGMIKRHNIDEKI